MRTIPRTFFIATFACLSVVAIGCSDKKISKVYGVVTYKNSPVKGGNMIISNDTGGSYSCTIQENGDYSVTDVPNGTYSVTIETETLNPDKKAPKSTVERSDERAKMNKQYMDAMGKGGGDGGTGAASREDLLKRYTKIPSKYTSKSTSNLQVEVSGGETKKNFELAD